MPVMEPIRDLGILEDFKGRLQSWNMRNWMFFVLGINTGLRVSDILPIKVKQVLGTHILLIEKKTSKRKRILINPKLRADIDFYLTCYEWLGEDDYLFASQTTGKPITTVQAYRILRQIGDIMGLEGVGTHTMRKTFGYHFYQRTKDIATLQLLLNHSTQRMTMLYIGLIQDTMDQSMSDFHL
ncbi:tyrosine-type recombinase/integrase [Paenibacillus peoriae]|uniref:tyrosine-type recombinase/integrase n=1 Tax=Paenibacillus peoriae TaxID=59893 RepID=UPI0032AF4245